MPASAIGTAMMEAFDARLGHIEQEVRRIADALDLMIRIDERQQSLLKRMTSVEDRVVALEKAGAPVTFAYNAWRKALWVALAAAAGFAFNVIQDVMKPSNPPVITLPTPHDERQPAAALVH